MEKSLMAKAKEFGDILGLDDEPMGLYCTDDEPEDGFSPKPGDLPTREKEQKGEVNWQAVFGNFSCAIGHIWRARKKKKPAYFSTERFGCLGAAFFLGFNKPQVEAIVHYVSTGIPDFVDGEFYCDSPDATRKFFNYIDPVPVPKKFLVVKGISLFKDDEQPEFVSFFCRPEVMSGLNQLAAFLTNDAEVVVSPWSASCGGLYAWPAHYKAKGLKRAVIGGWDPSARKFFKTDELSFTVPFDMFEDMVNRHRESFLKTETWRKCKKKVERSKKAWGEM